MVRVPVIATREFHDQVAARKRTRNSDCAHHSLGPGRNKADLFETWVGRDDALRQPNLRSTRRSVGRAVLARFNNRGNNGRMSVSQYQSAPGSDQIEIRSSVGV